MSQATIPPVVPIIATRQWVELPACGKASTCLKMKPKEFPPSQKKKK